MPLELLWEVRTPTFQLLAALVARTYDTVRYEQVASAQLNASRTDPLVRQSLHRAVADLARRVDHLEARSVDQISLVLRDGRTVVWGSADQSAEKAKVLQALLGFDAQQYDVSVPGRPTTSG